MDLSGMSFDPSTMTYLATQMQQPNAPDQDAFQDMLLPNEYAQEHQSTYGGYAASEDVQHLHSLHAPTPQLKRFSSAYEDPFSDVVSAFEHPTQHDSTDAETPSIDRDNKLLSFSLPSFNYTLLDYTYRRTTISLSAQLHGMFFLAESPWASTGDATTPPSELTCYRRNLFQITGEVALPRTLRYILTEQGDQIPIIGQELVISATESTEGSPVKIISVPWKTPANSTTPTPDDKIEREPPSIPLDLMNMQEMNTDFASFPYQWKRLQFRIATANNGRRKELQQHFVVRLKVIATLATGGKISICEVQSGAIIVRGRSPRNFQARKDMPLKGGGGHTRKISNLPGSGRAATVAGGERTRNEGPTSAPVKTEVAAPAMSTSSFQYAHADQPTTHLENYDWLHTGTNAQTNGGAPQSRATPPNNNPGNLYAVSSPDHTRTSKPMPAPPAPINLSLVEDDSPKPSYNNNTNTNSATPSPGRAGKKLSMPPRPPSFGLNTVNSPDESADLLYEYFPLGLDDWMPPVDAVYRPHVVHHTKLPTDPRDPTQSARNRGKRYFSEDVSV